MNLSLSGGSGIFSRTLKSVKKQLCLISEEISRNKWKKKKREISPAESDKGDDARKSKLHDFYLLGLLFLKAQEVRSKRMHSMLRDMMKQTKCPPKRTLPRLYFQKNGQILANLAIFHNFEVQNGFLPTSLFQKSCS